MGVSIPSPFDKLENFNWSSNNIGNITNALTNNGWGINIGDSNINWTLNNTDVSGGVAFNFNGTPSAINMTDELFVIGYGSGDPGHIELETLENDGIGLLLYTNDSNYKKWIVGGNNTDAGMSPDLKAYIIDPNSTATYSQGTLNVASVLKYGVFSTWDQYSAVATYGRNIPNRAVRIGTNKNDANIPRLSGTSVKLKELYTEVAGTSWSNVNHLYTLKSGDNYVYACPFVIGDGSTTTTFDDEGITIYSPGSSNNSVPITRLTISSMRVYFDLTSNDTCDISGKYYWGTRAKFDISSCVGANIELDNAVFDGMGQITFGSDTSGNATFNNCNTICLYSGCRLDGSKFTKNNEWYTLELYSSMRISNLTFNVNNRPVKTNTAGTYYISSCNFGSCGGYEVATYHNVGTAIFYIEGTTTSLGVKSSGSGDYSVIRIVPIEVNGVTDGTSCWIASSQNGLGIVSGNADVTGKWSTTYNYNGDIDVLIRARLKGYIVYNGEGTIDANGLNVTAVWTEDEVYNYT